MLPARIATFVVIVALVNASAQPEAQPDPEAKAEPEAKPDPWGTYNSGINSRYSRYGSSGLLASASTLAYNPLLDPANPRYNPILDPTNPRYNPLLDPTNP